MTHFPSFNKFERIPGTDKYILTEPLVWNIGIKNSGWQLIISEGTKFDISTPKYLVWLQSGNDEQVLPCAAIHDELLNRKFDAIFASFEFLRALRARNVKNFKSWVLFIVTLFWCMIRKNKKNKA